MLPDDIDKKCQTEKGACIQGQRIYVQCSNGPVMLRQEYRGVEKYGARIDGRAYAAIIEPYVRRAR